MATMDTETIAIVKAEKAVAAEMRYRAADRLRVCEHYKLMVTASESASEANVWLLQASEKGRGT